MVRDRIRTAASTILFNLDVVLVVALSVALGAASLFGIVEMEKLLGAVLGLMRCCRLCCCDSV